MQVETRTVLVRRWAGRYAIGVLATLSSVVAIWFLGPPFNHAEQKDIHGALQERSAGHEGDLPQYRAEERSTAIARCQAVTR